MLIRTSTKTIFLALAVLTVIWACSGDGVFQPTPPRAQFEDPCIICGPDEELHPYVQAVQWIGEAHNVLLDSVAGVGNVDTCQNIQDRLTEYAADNPSRISLADVSAIMSNDYMVGLMSCDELSEETMGNAIDTVAVSLGQTAIGLANEVDAAISSYSNLSSFLADIEEIEDDAVVLLSGVDRDVILSTTSVAKASAEYWNAEFQSVSAVSASILGIGLTRTAVQDIGAFKKLLGADVIGCLGAAGGALITGGPAVAACAGTALGASAGAAFLILTGIW
jgi:hypothetical protein